MDIFRGYGVEIALAKPADFLVVKETLTRIGVPDPHEAILYQSCHILHKQGRYVIIHHLELNAMDGNHPIITAEDVGRRNKIAALLEEWELVKIVNPEQAEANQVPINLIKIIAFKEKNGWELKPLYHFLSRKK